MSNHWACTQKTDDAMQKTEYALETAEKQVDLRVRLMDVNQQAKERGAAFLQAHSAFHVQGVLGASQDTGFPGSLCKLADTCKHRVTSVSSTLY